MIEWVQDASNTLRGINITFADFKDLSTLQAYHPSKYSIESSPHCNNKKLAVGPSVVGTCSYRKCKFSCENKIHQVSLPSAKCKSTGWRTKNKVLEVKCNRTYYFSAKGSTLSVNRVEIQNSVPLFNVTFSTVFRSALGKDNLRCITRRNHIFTWSNMYWKRNPGATLDHAVFLDRVNSGALLTPSVFFRNCL